MQVEIITDLTSEPITVAEVRDYLRITTTVEDTLLQAMITAARTRLEKFSNLSFGAKEIQVYWNEVTDWKELPYQPKATITSVLDNDGNEIEYETRGTPFLFFKCFGTEGVTVLYEVEGFVNDSIKEAIKKEIYTAYENRENFSYNQSYPLSNEAKFLVQPFSRNTLLGI